MITTQEILARFTEILAQIARPVAYALADSGNTVLFGSGSHTDLYYDNTTGNTIEVVSNAHGGVLGGFNELISAMEHARNSITLSDGLVVSALSPDEIGAGTPLLRHEGQHTKQAAARGPGYLPEYAAGVAETFVSDLSMDFQRRLADERSQDPLIAASQLASDTGSAIRYALEHTHDDHPLEKEAIAQEGTAQDRRLPDGWEGRSDTSERIVEASSGDDSPARSDPEPSAGVLSRKLGIAGDLFVGSAEAGPSDAELERESDGGSIPEYSTEFAA